MRRRRTNITRAYDAKHRRETMEAEPGTIATNLLSSEIYRCQNFAAQIVPARFSRTEDYEKAVAPYRERIRALIAEQKERRLNA